MLNTTASYISLWAPHAASQDITAVTAPLKDFHYHVSWLWGDWHLSMMRLRVNKLTSRFAVLLSVYGLRLFRGHGMPSVAMALMRSGRGKCPPKLTPLVASICIKNHWMCRVLIEAGSVVEMYELALAIRTGDVQMVDLICRSFIENQKRPVWMTFKRGLKQVGTSISICKDYSAYQDIRRVLRMDFMNRPLIDYALLWNKKELISDLITKCGISLIESPSNTSPCSSLETFITCCDVSLVKHVFRLYPHLANATIVSVEGTTTPLHLACTKLRHELVQMLIDNFNVAVNALDENGRLPIHAAMYAMMQWRTRVAFSSRINEETQILAAFECIQKLCASGSKVNILDKDGNAPIHIVLMRRYPSARESMLSDGLTRIDRIYLDVLEYLIQVGCDLNKSIARRRVTRDGDCPLHICCRIGYIAAAEMLLAAGANHNILNAGSKRCLDVCLDSSVLNEVSRLLEANKGIVPSLKRLALLQLRASNQLPLYVCQRSFSAVE